MDNVVSLIIWVAVSGLLLGLLCSENTLSGPTRGDIILYILSAPITLIIVIGVLLTGLFRFISDVFKDTEVYLWLSQPLSKKTAGGRLWLE